MAELFERVEVNREPRWQVLTRLIGGSLVLHLACLWVVIYVPAVRETVNIAALIASTRFVDKEYEATQMGYDVEVVQLEKFRYPEGYFAAAGQVDGVLASPANPFPEFAPKIISQAGSERNVDPEASPSPSPDASPSASPAASGSPSGAVAQASPSPAGSPLSQEDAQKQLEKTAEQNDVTLPGETEINKKVLKDFAAYTNNLKNEGKLDINKPFEIEIQATLDEKGKLVDPKIKKMSGDENLVEFFGKLVLALNDSGFLVYLQPISKDNPGATVKITVKQGEKELLASVVSEASSPERAETVAKVLNNLLTFGALSRAGKDEEVLMKNTSATPDGKRVVVNFSMPRQSVVDMIKKQLEPGV